MVKYIAKLVAAMFITLFVIISLSFFVIRLMPQSIFDDPELPYYIVQLLEERMGLHQPLYVQYFQFMSGIVRGDWGHSVIIRRAVPVFDVLLERLPITMMINVSSLFISLPIGILAGTVSALKRDKLPDHIVSLLVVLFISIPSFVFASLMQYFFTFLFPIFPTIYDPTAATFGAMAFSLALPVIALALTPIGVVSRYLRGELIETMSSEFLMLARTKGLSHRQAVVRHAFRNSCVPLVNIIIPMFTGIMGGSLVVERIFAIPGMGGILIDSINAGDHPLTIAVLLFFSIISLLTILIMDISYGLLDPRIKMGGKK